MNAPKLGFDPRLINQRTRPAVSTSAIERLLLRHVFVICPESRLCVNIIRQVFIDLCGPSREARRDARRFFLDGRLEYWCDLVDLSPAFVREVAVKTGYLNVSSPGGQHA